MSSEPAILALHFIELDGSTQCNSSGKHQALSVNKHGVLNKPKDDLSNLAGLLWERVQGHVAGLVNDCGSAAHNYRPASPRVGHQHTTSACLTSAAYESVLDTIREVTHVEDDPDLESNSQDGDPEMSETIIVDTTPSICNAESISERNEVLLRFQLDGRSLILDSARPDVAPHIVVTPPDSYDAWNFYWASLTNVPGPQYPGWLTVPIQSPSLSTLASLPPLPHPEGRWQSTSLRCCDKESGESPNNIVPEPRKIFSSLRLRELERQVVYLNNLVTAVNRHQYKASALAASSVAPSFRERWDTLELQPYLKRPFRWTDPAEPLLSSYSHFPGVMVIDSTTPCTTPHIVVHEPPPADPWAPHYNMTPNPQDCGQGYFLTVPSPFAQLMNIPPDPLESYIKEEMTDAGDGSEQATIADSDGPFTPDAFDGEVVLNTAFDMPEDEFEDALHSYQMRLQGVEEQDDAELSISGCTSAGFSVPMNDDDDDLPPFDDWYQQIASRTT
ncbi:uncharacterized protein FIBRA_02718 [Fibroporia radiculosa]|uniref:Uncharacterized protein n=1 Tax=Fibroporia radiculosa TaxID=599839 RepID=J4H204_9APHY|nr:uncharacterized protein FIBRA_02718 [Fibroporia radiculosa]CCM00679.1 predicted protein [Fibroporia radiculosa]